MAENFRNKQWFKKLTQTQKDEMCKEFDITEATLKKAGRETEDGRIVVDLLRIDHLVHHPEFWDECHNSLKGHDDLYKQLQTVEGHDNIIIAFENIFNVFKKNSYSKYKDSARGRVLISQAYKNILSSFSEYLDSSEEHKPYFAYMLHTHLRVLLDSDLKLIK